MGSVLIAVSLAVLSAGHAPVQQAHFEIDSHGRSSPQLIRSELPSRAAVEVTLQGDQKASAFAEELSNAISDQGREFAKELQELQAMSTTGKDDFEKLELGKTCDRVDSGLQSNAECKQAAKKVGIHFGGGLGDKEVQQSAQFKGLVDKAPPGCFWLKVPQGEMVFFNEKEDERPPIPIVGGVCKKAAGGDDDDDEAGDSSGDAGEAKGKDKEADADAAGDENISDTASNSSDEKAAKAEGGGSGVVIGAVLVCAICCGGGAVASQSSKKKAAPGQEGYEEEGEGEEEEVAAEETAADASLEEAAADAPLEAEEEQQK